MTRNGLSRPPRGLSPTGRRLWGALVAVRELDGEAQERLRNLCRLADELERLRSALAEAPAMTTGSMGQVRPNPLFEQVRAHTETLNRGLAQLTQSTPPKATPATSAPLNALERLRLCHEIRQLRYGGPSLPCGRLDGLADGALCSSCSYVMHEMFSHSDHECSFCAEGRARRQAINAAARAGGNGDASP
jgi:hypothetical protein